jgi:hypothetical protein
MPSRLCVCRWEIGIVRDSAAHGGLLSGRWNVPGAAPDPEYLVVGRRLGSRASFARARARPVFLPQFDGRVELAQLRGSRAP